MMKMNTKNLGALALLAVLVMSAGSVMAAEAATSDKFAKSLEQSLKHYVMALEAYNDGNYGEVKGQLQAAASISKHANPYLSNLLQTLSSDVWNQPLDIGIASQIATIYNTYNVQYGWNVPMFDPGNPTATPPGEHPTAIPPGEGATAVPPGDIGAT